MNTQKAIKRDFSDLRDDNFGFVIPGGGSGGITRELLDDDNGL